MRFLAEMGISPRTVAFLRSLGHDTVRLDEMKLERASDREIIAWAVREERVVLTFDLDSPALLALQPENRASTLIFRTANADPEWINQRLSEYLPLLAEPLQEGAIVTVEDARLRMRKFVDLHHSA